MSNIRYISHTQRDEQWGLTISSCGHQVISPGAEYPPRIHKKNYLFSPHSGRILSEFQIIYIIEGRGRLATKSSGVHKVRKGDIFMIFPGEWHSYAPDEDSGWNEYWIGFNGPNIEARMLNGFFSRNTPLYHVGFNEFIVNLYNEAIRAAKRQEPQFQQLLAGIVNHLLGILLTARVPGQSETLNRSIDLVNMAKTLMIDSIEENISMPIIASKLNVSYTTFRRQFKAITGMSPAQYFISIRIQRAKEMLLGTNAPIKEIAIVLQFESPEYFATLFKKKTGMSPLEFRKM